MASAVLLPLFFLFFYEEVCVGMMCWCVVSANDVDERVLLTPDLTLYLSIILTTPYHGQWVSTN